MGVTVGASTVVSQKDWKKRYHLSGSVGIIPNCWWLLSLSVLVSTQLQTIHREDNCFTNIHVLEQSENRLQVRGAIRMKGKFCSYQQWEVLISSQSHKRRGVYIPYTSGEIPMDEYYLVSRLYLNGSLLSSVCSPSLSLEMLLNVSRVDWAIKIAQLKEHKLH